MVRRSMVEAPPVDLPPVEEYLPPTPDVVAKDATGSMAAFVDGFADFLEGPIRMLRKLSSDMRTKRF